MGTNNILTVNAGSSSLKLVLFSEQLEQTLEATVANIGQPKPTLTLNGQVEPLQAADHRQAATAILGRLAEFSPDNLAAIGHRVVHGGQTLLQPTMLNDEVITQLREATSFNPGHMPVVLELIETTRERFPNMPQVACFDTAFYRDLPAVARLLPLPRKFEALGLRRYGFHGLSYEYLLQKFGELAGETAANGRVILAHLGSGVSLTAAKNGKPADTTMSFTPASGIPMSTRSGDLDPGIAEFLHQQAGISLEEFNHMVHFESGLLGVSELSADMELLIKESERNSKAADAVELFCYQARKAIGGLTAVLGGVDSLIFSGGMGEHAPLIRAKICEGLDYLGISLDPARNSNHDFLISRDGTGTGVHVLHTDEAVTIAKQTLATISKEGN